MQLSQLNWGRTWTANGRALESTVEPVNLGIWIHSWLEKGDTGQQHGEGSVWQYLPSWQGYQVQELGLFVQLYNILMNTLRVLCALLVTLL